MSNVFNMISTLSITHVEHEYRCKFPENGTKVVEICQTYSALTVKASYDKAVNVSMFS
jgi:hypothetical protein